MVVPMGNTFTAIAAGSSFAAALSADPYEMTVVPLPGALLLGAIGMGYAGMRLGRRGT